MPVKKARKPSRSIRYLLSADRTLQKISLRKISERVRRATSSRRTSRSVRSAKGRSWALLPSAFSPRAVVLAAACVVAAAVAIAARQPSRTVETASVDAAPAAIAAMNPAPAPVRTESRKATISRTTAKTIAPATKKSSPAVAPTTGDAPASSVKEASTTAPNEAEAHEAAATTTVSGCVDSDDGAFWLKDATGADVPKSRSWKSGFFKKRSAAIELLDSSRTLHLTNYVGQRVSVTGTLVDRELRARSLRRIAASCD